MGSNKKRKAPDSGSKKHPSSNYGARNDWRNDLDASIRVENRRIITEALYEDPYVQITAANAVARAASFELRLYLEAPTERDYLTMVGDFERRLRTQSEELGTILKKLSPPSKQEKGKIPYHAYPVRDVLQRQTISVMSRQHSECPHVSMAEMELMVSLDNLADELESLPNDLSEPVEILEVYEAVLQDLVEMISKHIKNICLCPWGVIWEADPCSAPVDLNSQMKHSDNSEMFPNPIQQPPLQSEQQPLEGLHSDGPGNTILPQQLLQKPGPNEDQTGAPFDDNFLAELMAFFKK